MAAITAHQIDEDGAESRRRTLMDESDRLLEEVESLRLADAEHAPDSLQRFHLQQRLDGPTRRFPTTPMRRMTSCSRSAMAANPNIPRPTARGLYPGRPACEAG
jgi:hypothetical protein